MTDTRARLLGALRSTSTLPALREALINLARDLAAQEDETPTLRSVYVLPCGCADDAPDTERDSAPSTLTDSDAGREFAP